MYTRVPVCMRRACLYECSYGATCHQYGMTNSCCIMLAVFSVSVCKYAIVRLLCATLQAPLWYATPFDGRKFIFYTSGSHFISEPDSAGTKVSIGELLRTRKVASNRLAAEIFHVFCGIQRSLLGAVPCLVPSEYYPLPDDPVP